MGGHRLLIAAEAMLGVAKAGDRLRRFRGVLDRMAEVFERGFDVPLPEEGPPDLQHEVDVVLVAEREDPVELPQAGLRLAELEEHLAQPGEAVLVLGVEDQRLLEAATGPGELVPGKARVAHPHVQLDRLRIDLESFPQQLERVVVAPLVVQGVRALVELFGTQERFGHGAVDLHSRRVTG